MFLCAVVIGCISLFQKISPENEFRAKNFDKPIFKSAYKNRNIASFDGDAIQGSEQLFQNNGNLIPDRSNYQPTQKARRLPRFDNKKKERNNDITVDDIYISIKTSKKYHSSRLQVIIDTWFQHAKNQVS